MKRSVVGYKNNKSNLDEFFAFVSQHKMSILFVWIFTIMIYGPWCVQNLVTFDSEGFFSMADGQKWYNQWYSLGRWSLILIKDIFNVRLINPYFQITLFGLFFPASVILWWFCFYRWNHNIEPRFGLVLFSAIYLSHPIWATQFSYRNQMESITILMCLMPTALLLLTDRMPEGRIPRVILSAAVTVICFGGYQSFLFMYSEGVILYLLFRLYHDYSESNRKDFWKEILFLLVFTVFCFVAYFIISYLLCVWQGLTYGTEYLSSQFRWGSFPAAKNIQLIAKVLYDSLVSNGPVFNCLGIIEILAGAVLICFVFHGRPQERILGFVFFAVSWAIPFLLLLVTAFPVVYRSHFSFVLVLAFWGAVELGMLFHILSRRCLTDIRAFLAILILMFTIFPQVQKSTRLLYTDYMTMYNDEIQLWIIYHQALAKGAHEGDPIVFLNGKSNYINGSMVELEVIGYSYFEFNGNYGGTKIIEAMRAYGMNVSNPTDEQCDFASSVADEMDVWPNAGGIVVQNGIIIVKL